MVGLKQLLSAEVCRNKLPDPGFYWVNFTMTLPMNEFVKKKKKVKEDFAVFLNG